LLHALSPSHPSTLPLRDDGATTILIYLALLPIPLALALAVVQALSVVVALPDAEIAYICPNTCERFSCAQLINISVMSN
jgi:hypothetical protein